MNALTQVAEMAESEEALAERDAEAQARFDAEAVSEEAPVTPAAIISVLSPEQLAALSPEQLAALAHGPAAAPVGPSVEERVEAAKAQAATIVASMHNPTPWIEPDEPELPEGWLAIRLDSRRLEMVRRCCQLEGIPPGAFVSVLLRPYYRKNFPNGPMAKSVRQATDLACGDVPSLV